jgi:hypothetical protein
MLRTVRRIDGDIALLLFLALVGLIPVAGDLSEARAFGAEATIGLLLTVASMAGALKRAAVLLRARSIQRHLLAGGRWTR